MAVPEVVGADDAAVAFGEPEQLEDERRLVERARTDRMAFAVLYRRYVDDVYRFAYRRCGSRDVAEEATSATFERALRAIADFEWRGHGIRPWLLRIASNEVAEIYRRRSRVTGARGQIALRALAPDERVGVDLAVATEFGSGEDHDPIDRAALHRALHGLSRRYCDAITLRYLAGMSADEAAAELGWTKSVLAVTLHRGLKALRSALSDQSTIVTTDRGLRGADGSNRDRPRKVRESGKSGMEVFRETNPT